MTGRLLFLVLVAVFPWLTSAETIAWPISIPSDSGAILLFQPQIDTFDGSSLSGRAAVAYQPTGATAPTFGAIWFSARTLTRRDEGETTLCNYTISNIRFPDNFASAADPVKNAILTYAAAARFVLPIAALVINGSKNPLAEAQQLGTNPPAILFATVPTVLVSIDGEPKLVRIENSLLLRAVNTPFYVVLDPKSRIYYLKGGDYWYNSTQATGPYAPAAQIPVEVQNAALQVTPQGPARTTPSPATAPPAIVVATQPTELIVSEGPEQFQTIPRTNLLYVANTDSDVFVEIVSQRIYVLLSGRWFSASNQNGPWSSVPPAALPVDFAMIASDSPKAGVLPFVIGTAENTEAVDNYQIPETAAIRTTARIPTITYDGQPNFEAIEGTGVDYAANCYFDVLKAEGRYYCCSDGVWYASDTALGPFIVTATIPGSIYSIPPSNPLYRVTFVRPFLAEPEMIWFGYYPGYLGSYLWNGTVVWGTGWNYTPWFAKFYVPRPATWGFDARYNRTAGTWGFDVGIAGTRGWIDTSRWGWWNPGGFIESRSRVDGNRVAARTNVYARDSSRLAIDTHREAIVRQATPGADQLRATYVNYPRLLTDQTGSVYKRDMAGYQRFDGTNWARHSDPGTMRDLDRQFTAGAWHGRK